MLQELHSKLITARNFELVAKFWDWYILLRISGVNGRLSCYWDHDQDCLGYNTPERLWELAEDIDRLEEQMQERGCPLTAIPIEQPSGTLLMTACRNLEPDDKMEACEPTHKN